MGVLLRESDWLLIEGVLGPKPKRPFLRRKRKGGRPRTSDRDCFNGLLALIHLRASWRRLPTELGHWTTIRRRILSWYRCGRLDHLWRAYLSTLRRSDLERLGPLLAARDRRPPLWWFTLDYIYRLEFAPPKPRAHALPETEEEAERLYGPIDWED